VNHSFEGFMRVKPGANIDRIRAEMDGVMKGVTRDFQASNASRVYVVRPLVEQIVGDLSSILIVVLSATALLLILACVNVTNLLLARGTSRLREIAVRVALGAGRGQILRQLLTESVVLAALGALAGLALASAGVRLMLAAGASRLPRLDSVPFDGPVLVFALVVTTVCGLVVGLAPALRLAGADLRTLMNESSRSASGGRSTGRWLGGLMIAEVALAVVLAAGAGWLVRGFDNLRSVDLGFAPEGLISFDATFLGNRQGPAGVDAAVQDLLGRIRALPGVTSASTTTNLPLAESQENSLYVELRGQPMDPMNPLGSRQRFVGPGFFGTMGIKLASGRDFSDSDAINTRRVVVVNETFVRRYLAGRDPIGARFAFGYPTINAQSESVVIGVVGDVRQRSVGVAGEPAFYTSDRQVPIPRRTFVIATRDDTSALQSAIRTEVRKTDPLIAVEIDSLSALVASTWERQQLGMKLMLVFGAVAVVLAAVGIYGVIAYATSERRTEVATRLALGASPGDVFRLILRQGRTLALVGSVIGLGLAYLSGRVIANRLYEVSAADPWILGVATLLMASIAALATAIPAFRASRVDPVEILRPQS
jgi:putative ABC transport system permease protein